MLPDMLLGIMTQQWTSQTTWCLPFLSLKVYVQTDNDTGSYANEERCHHKVNTLR